MNDVAVVCFIDFFFFYKLQIFDNFRSNLFPLCSEIIRINSKPIKRSISKISVKENN